MKLKPALVAWSLMLILTGLSVLASQQAHVGMSRFWMTASVAFIAWIKGQLLIRHFLASHRAGPALHRIVLGFAALAPLALLLSAWRE